MASFEPAPGLMQLPDEILIMILQLFHVSTKNLCLKRVIKRPGIPRSHEGYVITCLFPEILQVNRRLRNLGLPILHGENILQMQLESVLAITPSIPSTVGGVAWTLDDITDHLRKGLAASRDLLPTHLKSPADLLMNARLPPPIEGLKILHLLVEVIHWKFPGQRSSTLNGVDV